MSTIIFFHRNGALNIGTVIAKSRGEGPFSGDFTCGTRYTVRDDKGLVHTVYHGEEFVLLD